MRKPLLISLGVFVLVIPAALYFASLQLPALMEARILDLLKTAGFNTPAIPAPQMRLGIMRYEGINLDVDGISTIERLDVRYSPLGVFFTKNLKSVHIKGLNLTGEISSAGGVSLSGWSNPGTISKIQNYPLKALIVEKSRLSLLTEPIGGVSVNYDFQARRRKQDVDLQARAQSSQKGLGFVSSARGVLGYDGLWQMEIELEQGKFEIAPVKATRISGMANIYGAPGKKPEIVSEINAGGVTLYGFPWQNAAVTIETRNNAMHMTADMKSIGHDGIELGLNLNNESGKTQVSGDLHTEKFSNLVEYLKSRSQQPVDEKIFTPLMEETDVSIDFTSEGGWTGSEKSVNYNIKKNDQNIELKGKIEFIDDGSYKVKTSKKGS